MISWIILFVLITSVCAYFRTSLLLWSAAVALGIITIQFCPEYGNVELSLIWVIYFGVVIPLNVSSLRKGLISKPLFNGMADKMPTISKTEQEALDAGDVWWEAELFSGNPDCSRIRTLPAP